MTQTITFSEISQRTARLYFKKKQQFQVIDIDNSESEENDQNKSISFEMK